MTNSMQPLLQGTLDVLILKALVAGELHGLGIAQRVGQITSHTFNVGAGSLFPALHRLENAGWLRSRWDVSDNKRRAKYYILTAAGRRRLDTEKAKWVRISLAMAAALES